MLDELATIDRSAIEQLAGLRQEEDVLQERLAKMGEMRDKVSDAVFRKVRDDYDTRLVALDEQCRPLRDDALAQYRKLRTLYRSLESALEAARLDKEELEFRYTLGEFPESEFKAQLEEKDTTLAEHRAQIEEAATVRQAFLDVLGPEEELGLGDDEPDEDDDAPAAAATEGSESDAEDDAGDGSQGDDADEADDAEDDEEEDDEDEDGDEGEESEEESDDAEGEVEDKTAAGAVDEDEWEDDAPTDEHPVVGETANGDLATLPPTPTPVDEEATHVAGAEPATGVTATEVVPPVPHKAANAPEDATVILTRPRLIVMEGGVAIDEFVLGMGTTSIGRGPENVIVLNDDSVSRQHAAVVPTVDGFAICDLRSENGTYVNNERTQEQTLAHGDLIHVGTRTLIFRQR